MGSCPSFRTLASSRADILGVPLVSTEFAMNDASTAETPAKPKSKTKPRRHTPSLTLTVFVIVCLGLVVYLQMADPVGDHAVANILTAALSLAVFFSLSFWFTFRSAYSGAARMAWPLIAIFGGAVLMYAFPIVGVDGELHPQFRWRWAPPADATVGEFREGPIEQPATFRIDENAYAQFLGPNRNATLPDRRLETDWTKHPPEELWRIKIGAGWSPFSVAGDLAVTLEQRGPEEAVTCYDLKSGTLRWSYITETRHYTVMGGVGPRSAATLHDGRVFALGANGDLYCLQAEDGELLWSFDLLDHYQVSVDEDLQRIAWGRSGSPLIVDDMVVIPAGGSRESPVALLALEQATGEVVWEGGGSLPSYASPMLYSLNGQQQIVSVDENAVRGYDPQTGDEMWSHEWPGNSNADANCSQPQRVDDSHVFLSKGYGAGCALIEVTNAGGEWSTDQQWQNRRALKTKFTNVVLHDGHAYGLSDGILECVRLADGKSQWKRGRYGHGQVLLVGEVLLVQAESGEVAMVEATPRKFRELDTLDALNGQTWNNLCLAGDLLLVRNAEEAACYRLQLRQPAMESDASGPTEEKANPQDADEEAAPPAASSGESSETP